MNTLTPLITILVVQFNDSTADLHTPFATREGCSEALLVTSAAINVEWSKCEATFAPSVSMRPTARMEQ
jgi:hypothetical protein